MLEKQIQAQKSIDQQRRQRKSDQIDDNFIKANGILNNRGMLEGLDGNDSQGNNDPIQIISEEDQAEEEGENDDFEGVADENEEDDYIDLNNVIKDDHLTSQVVDFGGVNKENALKQTVEFKITDGQSNSNISEIARDFFLQTHGDK